MTGAYTKCAYVLFATYIILINLFCNKTNLATYLKHLWFHAQLVQKILNGLYFLLPFKVKEGLSEFLEQDGRSIKVRILWELNYLLFQATFNGYDEVARFHNVQMR